MADDKIPVTSDKAVDDRSNVRVAGRVGGGGRSVQSKRNESREENSSESGGVSSSPGGGRGNRSQRERRNNKEGRGKRGGGVAQGPGRSQDKKQSLEEGGQQEAAGGGDSSQQDKQSGPGTSSGKKNKRYAVRKRIPPKEEFDVKPNDVFITERSHFVGQVSKCKKLFDKGHREINLHGLGKAIPRAVNLACELKRIYNYTVDYTVNTSTVQLYDDVFDLENPDQPPTVRSRPVSSVDIKVFRSVNIP